ncbi:hypothetical protein K7X08_022597 [Anisodus acutangulus]|uniref:Uncharacterized protein n=1 Tax=Anisodus acutangulus TaxID=402998 RepID=A0A9Q1MHZ4_9SOLA|nr:hypothetical protein K7X08_022597 [Anisodus acutangulus]
MDAELFDLTCRSIPDIKATMNCALTIFQCVVLAFIAHSAEIVTIHGNLLVRIADYCSIDPISGYDMEVCDLLFISKAQDTKQLESKSEAMCDIYPILENDLSHTGRFHLMETTGQDIGHSWYCYRFAGIDLHGWSTLHGFIDPRHTRNDMEQLGLTFHQNYENKCRCTPPPLQFNWIFKTLGVYLTCLLTTY